MKKFSDLVRPFLGIVFGALLILVYLNYVQSGNAGATIALGVIALVFASAYLAIAILQFVLGDKIPAGLKNVFDILVVAMFPTLIFVESLIGVINAAEFLGPTGWLLIIVSLVGSFVFASLYVVASFVKSKVLQRLACLFGSIFFLSLVLNVLFNLDGSPTTLDNVVLVILVIYAIYTSMMFTSLKKLAKSEA